MKSNLHQKMEKILALCDAYFVALSTRLLGGAFFDKVQEELEMIGFPINDKNEVYRAIFGLLIKVNIQKLKRADVNENPIDLTISNYFWNYHEEFKQIMNEN